MKEHSEQGKTGVVQTTSKTVRRILNGNFNDKKEKKAYEQIITHLQESGDELEEILDQLEDRIRSGFRDDFVLEVGDKRLKPIGTTGTYSHNFDELDDDFDYIITDADVMEYKGSTVPIVQLQLTLTHEEAEIVLTHNVDFEKDISEVEPPATFVDQTGHEATIEAVGYSTAIIRGWFLATEEIINQIQRE